LHWVKSRSRLFTRTFSDGQEKSLETSSPGFFTKSYLFYHKQRLEVLVDYENFSNTIYAKLTTVTIDGVVISK